VDFRTVFGTKLWKYIYICLRFVENTVYFFSNTVTYGNSRLYVNKISKTEILLHSAF